VSNIKVKAILASIALVTAVLALSVDYHGGIVSAKEEPACNNQLLRGTYGNSFQFLNTNPPFVGATIGIATHLPGAGITVYTFDGQGNFSGPSTTSIGGLIVHDTVLGTYTVDANCMGLMNVSFSGGTSGQLEFVIVDDGNEIYTLGRDSGHIAVGTMKKQFPTAK
jgi:hypothetical protein